MVWDPNKHWLVIDSTRSGMEPTAEQRQRDEDDRFNRWAQEIEELVPWLPKPERAPTDRTFDHIIEEMEKVARKQEVRPRA